MDLVKPKRVDIRHLFRMIWWKTNHLREGARTLGIIFEYLTLDISPHETRHTLQLIAFANHWRIKKIYIISHGLDKLINYIARFSWTQKVKILIFNYLNHFFSQTKSKQLNDVLCLFRYKAKPFVSEVVNCTKLCSSSSKFG